MRIIFVTGGARSGKSAYALSQARILPGKKAFLATAQALDNEMSRRIDIHRKERGSTFDTYEEPIKISQIIEELKPRYDVMLIDCLTLWLSNIMYAGLDVVQEIDKLVGTILADARTQGAGASPAPTLGNVDDGPRAGASPAPTLGNVDDGPRAGASPTTIFIVSNEVGMGIVPENTLARQFRDYQGILNQHIAGIAIEGYLMVSGIPVRIK
ncbi:MAG: bifunctional adenosylcobinamide kinase/adenosylcobinamide-phosphate guanylyltransferase [Deltaproteobacteria bacterium]|nr:bifunctional adenosylcobinamide kinase/adenosylcobinamide-phosphate guanylyltransferase [Deltaproteobacteria bacterium]